VKRSAMIILNMFLYVMFIGFSYFIFSIAREMEEMVFSVYLFMLSCLLFVSILTSFRIRKAIKEGFL